MKDLLRYINQSVIDPLSRKLGTGLSSLLLGYGVAQDTVDVIVLGFVALVGVGMDILLTNLKNKKRGR